MIYIPNINPLEFFEVYLKVLILIFGPIGAIYFWMNIIDKFCGVKKNEKRMV